MPDITNNTAPAEEQIEIVELDDRLDMAFDPLSLMHASAETTNTNCNNQDCCQSPPPKPVDPAPILVS